MESAHIDIKRDLNFLTYTNLAIGLSASIPMGFMTIRPGLLTIMVSISVLSFLGAYLTRTLVVKIGKWEKIYLASMAIQIVRYSKAVVGFAVLTIIIAFLGWIMDGIGEGKVVPSIWYLYVILMISSANDIKIGMDVTKRFTG